MELLGDYVQLAQHNGCAADNPKCGLDMSVIGAGEASKQTELIIIARRGRKLVFSYIS